ncbi:MAG TPA: PAS domain S-box protein, partial [Micromonosporaceae bacterium]
MMPRLDGLKLVAALREHPRTAGIPVLLLSARAGQEASIEGLDAGADDYLVKPFAAAELLARVRANVELARLRTHHARWRTALVDSLQEAFFVADDEGTIIEINTAFTDITGYETDELPYHPIHPWWPSPDTDPDGYRQTAEAFATMMGERHGTFTAPFTHRDGRRLWATATFSQVEDPDTGSHVTVGTFRDVTAEHNAIQRDSALAALSLRLSQATDLSDALQGALRELRQLWQAQYVFAAILDGSANPTLTAAQPTRHWTDLPEARRQTLTDLPHRSLLTPVVEHTGAGVALEHPHGTMAVWIERGDQRPFTEHDRTLLALLAGHTSQALHRIHQIDQQRETALALQHAILGPAHLPTGFAVRYQPAS